MPNGELAGVGPGTPANLVENFDAPGAVRPVPDMSPWEGRKGVIVENAGRSRPGPAYDPLPPEVVDGLVKSGMLTPDEARLIPVLERRPAASRAPLVAADGLVPVRRPQDAPWVKTALESLDNLPVGQRAAVRAVLESPELRIVGTKAEGNRTVWQLRAGQEGPVVAIETGGGMPRLEPAGPGSAGRVSSGHVTPLGLATTAGLSLATLGLSSLVFGFFAPAKDDQEIPVTERETPPPSQKFVASRAAAGPPDPVGIVSNTLPLSAVVQKFPATVTKAHPDNKTSILPPASTPEEPQGFLVQARSGLKENAQDGARAAKTSIVGAYDTVKTTVGEAYDWTSSATRTAAERTVQVGSAVRDATVKVTNKAVDWTATRTRDATNKVLDGVVGAGDSIREFQGKVEDNTVQSMAAIMTVDGWGPTTRVVVGLVTSNVSGDAWDRQPPLALDPKRPTLFINGVFTKNEYAWNESIQVAQKEGLTAVAVVRNNTHFGLGDILQIIGHELGAHDITAIRARDAMRGSIRKYGIVYVEAHSQGSAIADGGISMLTPAERSRVIYEGNGSQTYVDGQKYGLKEATNIRYPKDPVPMTNDILKWVGLRPWKQDWVVLERQRGTEDWMGHNYMVNYLNGKRPEERR